MQVWRIPAYQPALLMLVLVAAAALNIYAHPSGTVRFVTLVFGLLCGAMAVAALRLQLVATRDGVAVQQLRRQEWIDWDQLADVEVVGNIRGAPSLRINRIDGTYVDVPPSLLQPSKPTSKTAVMGRLAAVAKELEARARAHRTG